MKARLKIEFEEFLQSGRPILSSEKSKQILEKLHGRITETTPRKITWIKWAAAAAVIVMIAGAAWLHHNTTIHQTDLVQSPAAIKENKEIIQTNNSDSIRRLVLSDNSVVKLTQGSSISYYTSFNTGRRDIKLLGKATFEVAKNVTRPFTVYAGNISTTVLGTRFMISTLQQNKVSVKLFEGKVVIRSTEAAFAMKDVYLTAGEQFVMDNHSKKFIVNDFEEKIQTDIPDTTIISLEFNQEPLAKVLASIGKQYNVQFKFSDDSFNNMLVTGKLLPSDSLDVVLSMLGNINGLSFKKVNNNKIEVARIH